MALITEVACPFDFQVKWKTTRKKKEELQRPEEGVETDLRIAQKYSCGANDNCCIRNCLDGKNYY